MIVGSEALPPQPKPAGLSIADCGRITPMRAASLLLALVALLSFASEVEAIGQAIGEVEHDYTIELNDCQWIGFEDGTHLTIQANGQQHFSYLYLGPFGRHQVPCTATQGLIGCCCILVTLIILPVVRTVRWKKKRGVA